MFKYGDNHGGVTHGDNVRGKTIQVCDSTMYQCQIFRVKTPSQLGLDSPKRVVPLSSVAAD